MLELKVVTICLWKHERSETTSGWNWKVIRGGEGGTRGARWHKSLSLWTYWFLCT